MPRYSGDLPASHANHAYGPVTLYRDGFGVPAAFAATVGGAQFGFGFAQAEDHLPELLFLALQAGGRLAQAFGPPCLESDRWARTLGFARDADAGLAQIDPDILREVIAPFVAGVNAYATRARPSLPAWAQASLPFAERDVLAIANLYGFALSLTADPQGLGTRIALLPWGGRPGTSPSTASNAFALRSSRTASGRPMLGANPHVHLSMPFLMYEARVKGGALDVRGSTFFGLPSFIFGYTPGSAWGVTINYADTFERYLLLGDGAGRYRYDSDWHAMQVREERLRVLGGADEILRVEESVHGPLGERNPANGRGVALAWATRGDAGLIEQLHRMNLARDRAGFERALERRATPNYSFMFADAGDELLYAHVGRVHERSRAPAVDGAPLGCGPLEVDWTLNDARAAAAPCGAPGSIWAGAVPGWTSATRWGELLPLAAFPLLRNPPRDWAQMANTPPWTATRPSPVSPCGVDALVAPCISHYPYHQNLRGVLFTERLDGSATLSAEQAVALLFNSRVPDAGYDPAAAGESDCLDGAPRVVMQGAERCGVLPALHAAWARGAESLTPEHRNRLAPGMALLTGWNGHASRDSHAAALFQDYVFALGVGGGDGDARRLQALERAIAFRSARSGRIDPAWGEVHQLVRSPSPLRLGADVRVPVSGTWQFMGTLNAFEGPYRPFLDDGAPNPDEDGIVEAGFGSAQMLLVELGRDGPRAWGASVYGASEDPSSPHFSDQARELFGRDRMRPLPFHEGDFLREATSVLDLR